MNKTAVYKHPLFLDHYTGSGHVESSRRLEVVYRELERPEVAAQLLFPAFPAASPTAIQLNHTAAYVNEVKATAKMPASYLDPDTRTSEKSYDAALQAAGAVIDGIGKMQRGEIDNGFCLVRPPGHHAERDRAMGFCLFNNVAVGAKWAIKHLGLERIMIIDWDLHHGNGTQNSFYRSDQVLYSSIHQFPLYPGSGTLLENGEGKGRGFTLNVPLNAGHGDEMYARIFNELLVPVARLFKPQLILVSSGFDMMQGDPLGAMRVSPAGIAYMARVLIRLAGQHCSGRILFVLEGGYDLENMHEGVLAVLTELKGVPLCSTYPVYLEADRFHRLERAAQTDAMFDQVISWTRQWWDI